MEEIVRDGLPATLYDFQFTLSNRNRPDCVIRIPGNKALLVIDSKFPLEGFELLRMAATEDEKKVRAGAGARRCRQACRRHRRQISHSRRGADPGDHVRAVGIHLCRTARHDFSDVIQKAHRAQVIVVSPNILMLAINTIQTVMKDARMREQADLIRKEVGVLVGDVKRLGERVGNLQRHFNQAETDLKDITVSTDKIIARGERIEKVELAPPEGTKTLI